MVPLRSGSLHKPSLPVGLTTTCPRPETAWRQQRGLGKPETFFFLGFTHLCGKSMNADGFLFRRKTVKARLSHYPTRSLLSSVRHLVGSEPDSGPET